MMRNSGERSEPGTKPVRLAERRVFSESFNPLYKEGMGLVEETAQYLDTDGRKAAKNLSRTAATKRWQYGLAVITWRLNGRVPSPRRSQQFVIENANRLSRKIVL